ncbi:MAG: hypothetical protein EHM61_20915, partial [Acidobacteria bacterium]
SYIGYSIFVVGLIMGHFPPLTSRPSPLATRPSPLATCHSPLATRHLPLALNSLQGGNEPL